MDVDIPIDPTVEEEVGNDMDVDAGEEEEASGSLLDLIGGVLGVEDEGDDSEEEEEFSIFDLLNQFN